MGGGAGHLHSDPTVHPTTLLNQFGGGLAVPLRRLGRTSTHWALTHMIEQTERQAGHTDIFRELIGGTTGR